MSADSAATLEAWATVAGVAAAVIAAVFAYLAYRKESSIEQDLRDAKIREQASLVAAWIGSHPDQPSGAWLIVRNASQVPIYNVTAVLFMDDVEIVSAQVMPVVPPLPNGLPTPIPADAMSNLSIMIHGSPNGPTDMTVALNFVDAAGEVWDRSHTGKLTRFKLGK